MRRAAAGPAGERGGGAADLVIGVSSPAAAVDAVVGLRARGSRRRLDTPLSRAKEELDLDALAWPLEEKLQAEASGRRLDMAGETLGGGRGEGQEASGRGAGARSAATPEEQRGGGSCHSRLGPSVRFKERKPSEPPKRELPKRESKGPTSMPRAGIS